MNTIPSELIAIPRCHGYFWHPKEEQVYSLKSGMLKPIKRSKEFTYNGQYFEEGFGVSNKGKKRRLKLRILKELKPFDYSVPYHDSKEY